MKENKILEIKNKVEALGRVTQHIFNELAQLRDLSVGTLETIKNMPDYEQAIEKLKNQVAEKPKKFEDVE
tara:strand:- start:24 stop:233 length:210 start_codon:yes stop_codon:yes gene_type:complete